MQCEIVAIGTELLLGQIVDTNSAWIGEQLALAGINSHFHGALVLYFSLNTLAGKLVSKRGVFPTGYKHRKILFACCDHPAVFRINLVILLQVS